MSRIVWIASYPKSGNTWLRAFLANFEHNGATPVDINHLNTGGISSSRNDADNALGIECSDLTPDEIDCLQPAIYRKRAERAPGTLYLKTHSAYTYDSDAVPQFPSDVTSRALYLVRNPLDVAISFTHHAKKTLDESIDLMSREDLTVADQDDRLNFQLRQHLFSWSRHVLSWLDQRALPLHVMRYEDMCQQPVDEFSRAIRFLGLDHDHERVQRAVAFSSFDVLQRQELEHGFNEKPRSASTFFRSGRVGSWREILNSRQVERLVRDHREVMNCMGYLSETGEP
jgi:aryl sulfotransferase